MADPAFGAFGKIPSVGDFFRIAAPPGFVTAWDEWLQKCLVAGTMAFGDRWDDLYMSTPIWRFNLSAGLVGPSAMLGILMPSVDRVGRRFPLTLMAEVEADVPPIVSHAANSATFEALEGLALAALDDDATKDGLAEGLSGVRAENPKTEAHYRAGARAFLLSHDGPADASTALALSAQMNRSFTNISVWSAALDGDTRMMICEGLPDGPNVQGLYDIDADYWKDSRL